MNHFIIGFLAGFVTGPIAALLLAYRLAPPKTHFDRCG
jgi:gas vesicle protein